MIEKKENRFVNTGVNSYYDLGFLILSLLNTCQTHLFSNEDNDWNEPRGEEIRIDIYNLLETVKSLIPQDEFEMLDRMVEE